MLRLRDPVRVVVGWCSRRWNCLIVVGSGDSTLSAPWYILALMWPEQSGVSDRLIQSIGSRLLSSDSPCMYLPILS